MCTSPLFRDPDQLTSNGKAKIYGMSDYQDFLYLSREYAAKLQRIPCGQCMECRLQKSKEWSYRLLLEAQNYPENECWFLTLTYDDEHFDSSYWRDYLDTELGEVYPRLMLKKKDLQDFMKRLRSRVDSLGLSKKLRFFGTGEYGSDSLRPHFHVILYGLPLFTNAIFNLTGKHELDLKLYKKRVDHPLYNSDFLSDVWGNGFVTISPMSHETAAYCARYCTKKKLGLSYQQESDAQQLLDQNPFPREFIVMSRKPGIARDYYDQHRDEIFKCDVIPLSVKQKLELVKPFRYYEKLFDLENEEALARIKQKRQAAAIESHALQDELTSKAEPVRLKDKNESILNKLKKLRRNEI